MSARTGSLLDDILPRVDAARCRRCADCPPVATCPAMGLRRSSEYDVPVVDESFCFGCYSCAVACPHGAILTRMARRSLEV